MKVKEFIEELQKLDQEKNIWVIYDSFDLFHPEVETIEGDRYSHLSKYGLKEGDYAMIAG